MPEDASQCHSFLRVGGTSRSYMVEDMVTSRTAWVVVVLLVAAWWSLLILICYVLFRDYFV